MWGVQDSFTRFVYPFLFDAEQDGAFAAAADGVASQLGKKRGRGVKGPLWKDAQFHQSEMDNLLPYVKRYLRLPENQRRFSLREEFLKELSHLRTARQGDPEPRFRFLAADLYLFFNGVGFLVLEIEPELPGTAVDIRWIEDLNADLASLGRPREIRRAEEGGWPPQRPLTIRTLIEEELMASFLGGDGKPGWQPMCDTFLPVYGAILLAPPDLKEAETADAQFKDFASSHLMVLRKTLPSSSGNPFSRQLFGDDEHNYMPYHNVIHTQSLEGGFVLAFDNGATHFRGPRSAAMQSYRNNYFSMMLLAMHQRMSILRYAMEAADAALQEDRAAKLRRLREGIYDFSSRCYFSQASVSEERDQLYRRWQRVFNVSQMYAELKEEIHDIDDYLAGVAKAEELAARELELRQEAEKTRVISNITFILLPITILSNVVQATPVIAFWLNFRVDPVRADVTLGMMFVIAIGLAFLIRRVFSEQRRRQNEGKAIGWMGGDRMMRQETERQRRLAKDSARR